jgi:multicomponent K+:H+ antiporter subunit G
MIDFAEMLNGLVAVLLLVGGLLSLVAALGLLTLPDFFQRMHAPALATTLGTWCVALASLIHLSILSARPDLRGMVIIVLLALTAPITTTLLARAALFRQRSSSFADRRDPSSNGHGAAQNPGTSARNADVP